MSDDREHDDHDAHDAHDHGFDGEPAKELGPEESPTPGWIPALGGALFLGIAIAALASADREPGSGAPPEGSAKPTTAAQTVAQPLPSVPGNRPSNLVPGMQPGAPGQQPSLTKLSPDQVKDLEKRFKEAQERKAKEAAGAH